jgi:hypothetical protein
MKIRRAENKDMVGINKLLHQVLMVHHKGRPDLFKANVKKYTDAELQEIIEDDALISIVFNMAQELVQEQDPRLKEVQALNIIVGSSFALLHAIQNYKEIKNEQNSNYRS